MSSPYTLSYTHRDWNVRDRDQSRDREGAVFAPKNVDRFLTGAARIARKLNRISITRHINDTWVIPSLWRATPPVASELLVWVIGLLPISFAIATCCAGFEPRVQLPPRSRSPARAGGWRKRSSTVSGFPCWAILKVRAWRRLQPRRNRWSAPILPNGPGQAGFQRRRPAP